MGLFKIDKKSIYKNKKLNKKETDAKEFPWLMGKKKTLTIDETIDIEELLED